MSHPDFILDKRVVERNIGKGKLTYADVDAYKAALTDVEDNAEVCAPDAPEEEATTVEAAAEGTESAAAPAPTAPDGE